MNRLLIAVALAALSPALASPAAAGGARAPRVVACNASSIAERQEQERIIREEYLPGLQEIIDDPTGLNGDRGEATREKAEWMAQLADLVEAREMCDELAEFEGRGRKKPARPAKPPKPPKPSDADDELIAPLNGSDDELIAPLNAADDELIAPLDNSDDELIAPLNEAGDELIAPLASPPKTR